YNTPSAIKLPYNHFVLQGYTSSLHNNAERKIGARISLDVGDFAQAAIAAAQQQQE
ncbi:hypothetical protein OnM2_087059, partial [Erysiphe neolycopersici]